MTYRNWRLMTLVLFVSAVCAIQADHQRNLGDLGFAMDIVEQGYVEKVDRYELYQAAMAGMMKRLDQYSGYIEPEKLPAFESQIQQQFGGLGIVMDRTEDNQPLKIFTVLYDSPAFKAGIIAGDSIEAIDGKPTISLKIEEASKQLRGRPGTEVTLAIRRKNEAALRDITVRRAIIQTESVTGDRRKADGRWDFTMQADPRLAYIRVEIFGEKTTEEFREAIVSVRDRVQGLIIDLRDNAGGLLPTATDLCDMFLENGRIVSTRGRRDSYSSTHDAEPGVELYDTIPILIIVNDQSASASEVMAACLQDHGRAKIVGERSFGKGSVQNVIDLEGGKAALKVTSAQWFPPSDRNIDRRPSYSESDPWGVFPDPGLEVKLSDEQRQEVYVRLRDRQIPSKADSPNNGSKDTEDSVAKPQDRDPSLSKDIQLQTAVAYLVDQLNETK